MALHDLMAPGTEVQGRVAGPHQVSGYLSGSPPRRIGQACWPESAIPQRQREEASSRAIFSGDDYADPHHLIEEG